MQENYWHKQSKDSALFPDMLWSRPENKKQAGKLLIIGGNAHGMQAPAEAYAAATEAGIGVAKVLLPDALHKLLGGHMEHIVYAPSNKSGGFSMQALSEWTDFANWADGVLLAGDTARNSETAILMEKFLSTYKGMVCITQDCLDQFVSSPLKIMSRPNTLIVATFGQLQKMWHHLSKYSEEPLTHSAGLPQTVKLLHEITGHIPSYVVTKYNNQVVVAVNKQVSTTETKTEVWRTTTAATCIVWWLQNPINEFQAITTSLTT